MSIEAIVLAAGEGRRLRPVTEAFAKAVLPIDGRPVLGSLLRELAKAECGPVTIVTGYLAQQVEGLAGSGEAFGVEVRYARQPRPDGSADAVHRALAAGAKPPCLVVAADTLFAPGDVAAFAAAFRSSGAAGGIAARRNPPPGPGKPPLRVVDGLVERVIDDDPANMLTSGPLWALGAPLAPFLDGLPGPPFELSVAFQRAIDAGKRVVGPEIGATRDLTHPLDLVKENFSYLR